MDSTTPARASNDGSLSGGDQGRTTGMPLGARRLVLVGGLCIPVGLLAGPYLFGVQLLAVAGVVAVSIALSYGLGPAWFTRWPRLAAAAGGAWIAATISYWLTVVAAADAPDLALAPEVSSVLFFTGVAAFTVMAAAVLAGTVARVRSRRISVETAA